MQTNTHALKKNHPKSLLLPARTQGMHQASLVHATVSNAKWQLLSLPEPTSTPHVSHLPLMRTPLIVEDMLLMQSYYTVKMLITPRSGQNTQEKNAFRCVIAGKY
ncbi:hypothetical protein CHARACLAT_019990 [Characodon lateralis]|uniref:Uncharacterized protein n=1 Tax=Characodon lateralis TaxID=208331 RepID=A0ABU7DI61_9TELE|nr:hypothetical protein [Characodon lateralis]